MHPVYLVTPIDINIYNIFAYKKKCIQKNHLFGRKKWFKKFEKVGEVNFYFLIGRKSKLLMYYYTCAKEVGTLFFSSTQMFIYLQWSFFGSWINFYFFYKNIGASYDGEEVCLFWSKYICLQRKKMMVKRFQTVKVFACVMWYVWMITLG